MPQYEYKIIRPYEDGNPDSEDELNDLGAEGWLLTAVIDRGTKFEEWIFTRTTGTERRPL